MKRLLMTMLFLLPLLLSADEVYKTVDQHGNTVFSDTPSAGAEKIELKEIQTVPALKDYEPPAPKSKPVERYQGVKLLSPKNDETIWDNEGNVNVSIAVDPQLLGTDKVAIYLDGEQYSSGKNTGFVLTGINRGTHKLHASVTNSRGEVIKSSDSIVFHMKQHSVLNNPSRPVAR